MLDLIFPTFSGAWRPLAHPHRHQVLNGCQTKCAAAYERRRRLGRRQILIMQTVGSIGQFLAPDFFFFFRNCVAPVLKFNFRTLTLFLHHLLSSCVALDLFPEMAGKFDCVSVTVVC